MSILVPRAFAVEDQRKAFVAAGHYLPACDSWSCTEDSQISVPWKNSEFQKIISLHPWN